MCAREERCADDLSLRTTSDGVAASPLSNDRDAGVDTLTSSLCGKALNICATELNGTKAFSSLENA